MSIRIIITLILALVVPSEAHAWDKRLKPFCMDLKPTGWQIVGKLAEHTYEIANPYNGEDFIMLADQDFTSNGHFPKKLTIMYPPTRSIPVQLKNGFTEKMPLVIEQKCKPVNKAIGG